MLTKIQLHKAHHQRAAKNSLNLLRSKPLATLMTVVVIAITLTLPALFWVFANNVKQLTHHWDQGGRISLYLTTPLSPTDESDILKRVRSTAGVGLATLKSAAEGLDELQRQEGMDDIRQYLSENPLPAVIEVLPAEQISQQTQIEQLYQQLKSLPHVDQAKLDLQWIGRFYAMLGFVSQLANGLMVLLSIAVVFIISNTLRLAVHSRHEEIQVLKLIGAADSFILRPFLYSGIWYGLAGASLAIVLVNGLMLSLVALVNRLAALYQMHYPLSGLSGCQVLLLIVSATGLGWLGARLTVKRQLDFICASN